MTTPASRIPNSSRLHLAKDGHTGIVRFLGGRVSAPQWEQLAALAVDFGDGTLHLTSRGGVQVRGISDPDGFSVSVRENPALPTSAGCPQVLASSSISQELLQEFADCVEQVHNDRLLIGFDDGLGDVLVNRPDFGFVEVEGQTHVIVAGNATGMVTTNPSATLRSLLHEWGKETAPSTRRVGDDFSAAVTHYLETLSHVTQQPLPNLSLPCAPRVGWMQDEDLVTLGLGIPMATISSTIAQILGAVGAPTTITGWPSLMIHNLNEGDAEAVAKVLAPQGMIFDAASPWLRVTSCVGTQGCTRALSDVRNDAHQFLTGSGDLDGRIHFSGCERRCGRPTETTVDYIATGDGEYEVITNP